jgi:hypothetical protein
MELSNASLFSRNWSNPWIFTPFKYNPREFSDESPQVGIYVGVDREAEPISLSVWSEYD